LLSTTPALNADAAVASLADSLADPTAPLERRREAAERLRDLLADYPSAQEAVGSAGLPALAAALRQQPRDLETLRAVLECLSSALGEAGTVAASNATAAEAEIQQVSGGEARVFSSLLSLLPSFFSPFSIRSFPFFLSYLSPLSLLSLLSLQKKKRQSPRPPSTASSSPEIRPMSPRCSRCFRKATAAAK